MKRRVVWRIALSLLLGAVTSVAVAWSAATLGRTTIPSSNRSAMRDSAGRMWLVWGYKSGGRETWMFWQHEPDMILARQYDELAAQFHPAPWASLPSADCKNGQSYWATAYGLPAPCLTGTEGDGRQSYLCLGPRNYLYVPIEPIWRGMAVDTAAWGAGWAALLVLPGLVRSRRRLRDGCCAKCGYDLAGLPAGKPCPECGRV